MDESSQNISPIGPRLPLSYLHIKTIRTIIHLASIHRHLISLPTGLTLKVNRDSSTHSLCFIYMVSSLSLKLSNSNNFTCITHHFRSPHPQVSVSHLQFREREKSKSLTLTDSLQVIRRKGKSITDQLGSRLFEIHLWLWSRRTDCLVQIHFTICCGSANVTRPLLVVLLFLQSSSCESVLSPLYWAKRKVLVRVLTKLSSSTLYQVN